MKKQLKDDIKMALEEKARFNDKIDILIDRFYKENPNLEILKIIDLVISSGAPRYRKSMEIFKDRYENDCLEIEDTFFYLDMYEMNKQNLKNNEEEV